MSYKTSRHYIVFRQHGNAHWQIMCEYSDGWNPIHFTEKFKSKASAVLHAKMLAGRNPVSVMKP